MDEKTFHKQSMTRIHRLSWRLPVIIGLIATGSLLIDQLFIAPYFQAWFLWTVRFGMILVVVLAAWLITARWVRLVESPWATIDQRLLAMRSLVDITVDIVSELDQDKVLQNIAQRAADLVSAQFGCVFLYDEKQDGMLLAAQTPYQINLMGRMFKKGQGVVGTVFETGKPAIINGYTTWERRIPDSVLPLDAFIGVPLTWKGSVIGSLSIGDELKRRSFEEADAEMLQPFADLASIAINNSKIFGEEKQLAQELERREEVKTAELALTREELIQKTVQLQGLFKRLTKIQESERARISHDMHDSTTQLILAAVYATQAVMDGMDSNPKRAKVQLLTVQMLLHQIEIEIRETIRNLRPIILDQEGVAIALRQYIERVTAIANLNSEFQVNGIPIRLPEETEVAIYRIVQEALQNITTHARAKKVIVSIEYCGDHAAVFVKDDGIGFVYSEEALKNTRHFGLTGMQERAEAIGASIHIISQPGQGTSLTLTVPYPERMINGSGHILDGTN